MPSFASGSPPRWSWDSQLSDDLIWRADPEVLDQKSVYARNVGREAFSKDFYVAICKCFCKLQRNGVLRFGCRLSDFSEASAQLDAIEVAAGEKHAAPPLPPPRSQGEILEEQVREDWKKLPSDKLRAKMNRDPQYKQVFDRLMAADQLDSTCTTWTNGTEFQR